MDLEELNTSQIILLALLISFVTSIATGIVTVSLLAQAPPAVTNTVNQIVERTIETIVPTEVSGPVTQTVKETTVVVKEEDLITDSIAASFGKTGRVYQGIATSTSVTGLAAHIGAGLVITDSAIVTGDHFIQFGSSGAVYAVSQTFPQIGVAILSPKATSTVAASPSFKVGDAGGLKLGATAIALISVTQERVAIGAISSRQGLADIDKKDGTSVSVRAIETNIGTTLLPGTPLVNVFGDIIGVATGPSQGSAKGAFVAVSDIAQLLAATASTTPKTTP